MSGDFNFSFQLVLVFFGKVSSVLQTQVEHTSLKKANLQNSPEHTGAAGRLTQINKLVKLEGLISFIALG